jgi:hypothetical protein
MSTAPSVRTTLHPHHWLLQHTANVPKAILPCAPDEPNLPDTAYYQGGYGEDAFREVSYRPLTSGGTFHVLPPHAHPIENQYTAKKQPLAHQTTEHNSPPKPHETHGKEPTVTELPKIVPTPQKEDIPHAPELSQGGINLRKLIPMVGVGASLAWGVGNIAEHMLHDGHVRFFSKGLLGKGLLKLAQWLPLINIGYGAVNAAGAILNGYALRSLAFTAFSAASLVAAPKLMKGNQFFTKLLNQAQKEGFHEVSDAIKNPKFHSWFKKNFTDEALKLKKFSALFNATVPIGVLMGVFTLTKAAQSLQGVKLLHPHGNTLAELQDPHNPVPVGKALIHNAKAELNAFTQLITNLPQNTGKSFKAFQQGLTRLGKKDSTEPTNTEKTSEKASKPSGLGKLWCNFATPVFNSPFTATTYALTGIGRMVSAAFAVALASQGATHLLTKGNVMNQLAKTAPTTTPQAQKLMGGIGTFFLAGQLAGAVSAVFTRFNDWNPALSAVYRISAIPYALSGFSAMNRSFKPLGLGAEDMAKFGAFIQATSYLVNLVLKDQAVKPEGSSSKAPPAKASERSSQEATITTHPTEAK